MGDRSRPATDELIISLERVLADRAGHDHPAKGGDLFCLNLTSFMGERMGPVLARLRAAEAGAPTIRTLLGHQQRTSAALSELARITAAMATEMAQLASPEDACGEAERYRVQMGEADAEVEELREQRDRLVETRDQLATLVRDILMHFTVRGNPGRESLRTGWILAGTVAGWRTRLHELVFPPDLPPG